MWNEILKYQGKHFKTKNLKRKLSLGHSSWKEDFIRKREMRRDKKLKRTLLFIALYHISDSVRYFCMTYLHISENTDLLKYLIISVFI